MKFSSRLLVFLSITMVLFVRCDSTNPDCERDTTYVQVAEGPTSVESVFHVCAFKESHEPQDIGSGCSLVVYDYDENENQGVADTYFQFLIGPVSSCVASFDAQFVTGGRRYTYFGTKLRNIDASTTSPFASGTYTATSGELIVESGTFRFWEDKSQTPEDYQRVEEEEEGQ